MTNLADLHRWLRARGARARVRRQGGDWRATISRRSRPWATATTIAAGRGTTAMGALRAACARLEERE